MPLSPKLHQSGDDRRSAKNEGLTRGQSTLTLVDTLVSSGHCVLGLNVRLVDTLISSGHCVLGLNMRLVAQPIIF